MSVPDNELNKLEAEVGKVADEKPAGNDATEAQQFMKDLVKRAHESRDYQKNTDGRPTGPATNNFGRLEIHDDSKVIVKGAPSGTDAAGKPIKSPEQMTASERAAAKINEYTDTRTNFSFKFDDAGRPVEISKDGGTLKLSYDGKAETPRSFSIVDKNGQEMASGKDYLSVDLRTGEVKQQVKLPVAEAGVARIDSTFLPDGKIRVATFSESGLQLQDSNVQAQKDGTKVLSSVSYTYLAADGKPAANAEQVKSAISEVRDQSGNVTDRYYYGSKDDAKEGRALAREHVSYSEDRARNTITERHDTYRSPDSSKAAFSVLKTLHADTGAIELEQSIAGGNTQKVTFDKSGNVTDFERTEGKDSYKAIVRDGVVQSVLKNGQEIPAANAEQVKQVIAAEIQHLRAAAVPALQDRGEGRDVAERQLAKEMTGPSGDLYWKEGDRVQHAKVENGVLKDKDGKSIGIIYNNGDVEANGKSFNISKYTEGAYFRGTTSDRQNMNIASDAEAYKWQGLIKGPDGKEMYTVINDLIFDKDGKYYAYFNAKGQVAFDGGKPPATDFNSLMPEGTRFEGLQYGLPRVFTSDTDSANGKIYFPDEKTGKAVEYQVWNGMILDKRTHEQVGVLKSPKTSASGEMEGGSIILMNSNPPGQERPLRDFTNAVFDLQLLGQRRDITLQGIAIGPQSGTEGAGGLVNIQHVRDLEEKSFRAAEVRYNEWHSHWDITKHFDLHTDDDAENSLYSSARSSYDNLNNRLNDILATGSVSDLEVNRLGYKESHEKAASIGDPLLREKQRLDDNNRKLEDLPRDPSTINGSVRLADMSTNPPGHRTFQISNGEIIGEDGKPVGKIVDAKGHISFQNQEVGMKDLAGSVWHMEYPGAGGNTRKVDWVSLGTNGGVVSIDDLKTRASAEVRYAEHFNDRNHTVTSESAVGQTKELRRLYNEQLDAIIRNGVNSSKDLELLMRPPSDSVRAEAYKDHPAANDKPPRIEIPELNENNLGALNGHLRVGNETFALAGDGKQNCLVYRVHFENGKEVRDKEPIGHLTDKYTLELNGRSPISLASVERVLMNFTLPGDAREHRILGMGPGHYEAGKGFRGGGLVEADQLLNEASQAHLHALKGNIKYFEERPYLNGALGIGASDSSIMGNREGILKDFEKNIAKSEKYLSNEIEDLFKKGFDSKDYYNNKLDESFKYTEMLMDNLGWSGKTSYDLALDGIQQQKLANDAIVMAATTVATAGVGSIISGLVNTGRLTAVSGYALEIGSSGVLGGSISTIGRASESSDGYRNFAGGFVEGSAMGFGSSFGRALGNLKQLEQINHLLVLQKAGRVLNPEELAVVNSLVGKMVQNGVNPATMNALYYSARMGDSALQTTAFSISGALRERDQEHAWDHVNASNIALGTLFMFGTQQFAERLTTAPGKVLESSGLDKRFGLESGTIAKTMGLNEAGLASRAMSDSINAYSNAALGAIAQGYEQEHSRVAIELAAKLGVAPEDVPSDMIEANMSFARIATTVNEAGLQAMLTAPMLTLAMAPAHSAAERALDIKRDDSGRLVQPGSSERTAGGVDQKAGAASRGAESSSAAASPEKNAPAGAKNEVAPGQGEGRADQPVAEKSSKEPSAGGIAAEENAPGASVATPVEASVSSKANNGDRFAPTVEEKIAQRSLERAALKDGGVFTVKTEDGAEIKIVSRPQALVSPSGNERIIGKPETDPRIARIAEEGKSVVIGGQPYVVHGENVYRARFVDEKGKVISLYTPGTIIAEGRQVAFELQPNLAAISGKDTSDSTVILRRPSDSTADGDGSAVAKPLERTRTDETKDSTVVKSLPAVRFEFERDPADNSRIRYQGEDHTVIHAEPGMMIINRPENMNLPIVEPRTPPPRERLRSFELEGFKYFVDSKDGTVYCEVQRKDGPHLLPSPTMKGIPLERSPVEVSFPNGQKISTASGEIEINRFLFQDKDTGAFTPNSEAVSRKGAGVIGRNDFGTYIRDDGTATSKIYVKSPGDLEYRELKPGENYYIKRGDDVQIGNSTTRRKLDIVSPTSPEGPESPRLMVLDTAGRLTKITDESGRVIREFEWRESPTGVNQLSKVVSRDGSVWESTDGVKWTVYSATRGHRTEEAAVQMLGDGDIVFHLSDGSRRRENVDGSGSFRPASLGHARVGYDEKGAIKTITDASGVTHEIERTGRKITKITSSDGDVIEWRKANPNDPPGSEKYHQTRNGKDIGEALKVFVSESGIEVWDGKNGYRNRGIDGSAIESQPDHSLRLVAADLNVERARLKDAAFSKVTSASEQLRLVRAMADFEATAAKLSPEQTAHCYHEINQLIHTEPSRLPLEQRMVLAEQLLRSAARPFDINQGYNPVCTAAVLSVRLMATNPSEAMRIVTEAVTTGQVVARDGTLVQLDSSVIQPDAGAAVERANRLAGLDNTNQRAHADQILQNVMINYFWAKQGTTGPGGVFAPNGIRYARGGTVNGPHDNGYRLFDVATGKPLLDHRGKEVDTPYLYSSDLQSVMGLTGDKEPFVIINDKTTRREGKELVEAANRKQRFNTEEGLVKAIEDMKPSEQNPIVITVTTQMEPFYTDSGAGRAGGSGGQHVISIVGMETRRELGPDGQMHDNNYVFIDNQWGANAEHLAKPVKLHDLFIASHFDDDSQLIGLLKSDLKAAKARGQVDPNIELSLLRAQNQRWERADKTPTSMNNTIIAHDLLLSPKDYRAELGKIIARIDANDPIYGGADQNQLAAAKQTAEETMKLLDAQIQQAAQKQGQATPP